MSDYRKITKATGKMYLIMFAVSVFFMIISTTYMLFDSGAISGKGDVESRITTEMNEAMLNGGTYVIPQTGLDLSSSFIDNYGIDFSVGFMITMLVVCIMLFIREISFADIRAREFELTLPVKKASLVMHEYLTFLAIILAVTFMQGLILMLFQNHYNSVWAGLIGNDVRPEFISIPMGNLWTMVIIRSVMLLIVYTWIFLGMTLAKNSITGGIISIVMFFTVRVSFDPVMESVMSLILGRSPQLDTNGMPYDWSEFMEWENKRDMLDRVYNRIYDIIFPGYSFEYNMDIKGFFKGSFNSDYNLSIKSVFFVYALILAFQIIILAITSGHRKLSSGKIFYFKWVDALFALACGIMWYTFIWDWLDLPSIFILFSVIVVAGVVYYIVNPVKNNGRLDNRIVIDNKDNKGKALVDYGRLFRFEWKRYFAFIIIGLIVVLYNYYSAFNDHHMISSKDIDNYIKYAPGTVVNMFDVSADMINYVFMRNIVSIAVLIMISRLFGYFLEKNSGVREFHETIPVKRSSEFRFYTIMDMAMVIVPMAVCVIVSIMTLQTYYRANGISMEWLPNSILGLCLTGVAYLLMVEALMVLIEQMFPNGLMRLVGIVGAFVMIYVCFSFSFNILYKLPAAQILYGIFSLKLVGGNYYDLQLVEQVYMHSVSNGYEHERLDVPVLYNGESLGELLKSNMNYAGFDSEFSRLYDYSHVSSYMGFVLLYIALAALFILFAYKCHIKKDHSRQGLYFTFEKYILAGVISVTVLCMMAGLSVSTWHSMLVIAMVIILYIVFVKLMTPRNTIVNSSNSD
ncbi:MAG: hypothetical protein IJ661_08400 [Lachnospiraceae bacterium]|nr:hypothetical protein [Lachnospiraceae bacterium]